MSSSLNPRAGFSAALFAFFAWGLLPVYWKSLQTVPPLEILCHRVVWSLLFVAVILTWQRRWAETRSTLGSPATMGMLLLSSCLIAANWFAYIWAVNNGHVLETSLGYYINPLVNVLLGRLFFGDRLRPVQAVAIGLACFGVGYMILDYGHVPWVALCLAFSFGFYGLCRKVVRVAPLPGLFWETALLTLPAAAYLFLHGTMAAFTFSTSLLLVGAGVVTSLPLWAFAFAARNLSLITVGLLQYIGPSCAFLLGVFVYGEHFTSAHLVTFSCIWGALALYSGEGLVRLRRRGEVAA